MNFKVKCIRCNHSWFTVGKVYEIVDGRLKDEDNYNWTCWATNGRTFESLMDWFRDNYPGIRFELVEEKAVDFKVKCTWTREPNNFTVGKVYEVCDGLLYSDLNNCYDSWSDPGVEPCRDKTFESLRRWFNPYCTFELVNDENVEDEKLFTKNNLKTGDVVKYRNGEVGIVFAELGSILFKDDSYEKLERIEYNLTVPEFSNYDIMAVRRPTNSYECRFGAFEHELGELVYERKEPIVEEMTLEEVCEALGKKIKIVESNVCMGA